MNHTRDEVDYKSMTDDRLIDLLTLPNIEPYLAEIVRELFSLERQATRDHYAPVVSDSVPALFKVWPFSLFWRHGSLPHR